jgi:cell division control protein 11
MLPFAVVGSEEEVEIDGEPVRARVYPWGLVEVDNPNHSDFVRLRGAILGYVSLISLHDKLTALYSSLT